MRTSACSACGESAKIMRPLVSRSRRWTGRTRGGRRWGGAARAAGVFCGPRRARGGLRSLAGAAAAFASSADADCFATTRCNISSSVGIRSLRRPGQSRSSAWRSVVTPAGFSITTRCSSMCRTRTSSAPGGAARGCSNTFTTSPAFSRRPSSTLRLPLTCTCRLPISRLISDQLCRGSSRFSADASDWPPSAGRTWKLRAPPPAIRSLLLRRGDQFVVVLLLELADGVGELLVLLHDLAHLDFPLRARLAQLREIHRYIEYRSEIPRDGGDTR